MQSKKLIIFVCILIMTSLSALGQQVIKDSLQQRDSIQQALKDTNSIAHEQTPATNQRNFIEIARSALAGILLMFFGGIVVYWVIKNQINRILATERITYLKMLRSEDESYFLKFIGLVYILKQQKDKYKNESDGNSRILDSKDEQGLQEQLEILNKKIKELESQNSTLQEVGKEDKKMTIDKLNEEEEINQNSHIKSTLYFSIPESEGKFKIINGKPTSDENKFYKIEFDENTSSGKLYFIPGDLDIRAINDIDSYLIPVCEIENISNRKNANKIEFSNPGKVTLMNDCWVIDPENKVKVKLV
jgi:hypothetical protein